MEVIYMKQEFEYQETNDEKPEQDSLIKNVEEDENHKECNEINFEQVLISEDNTVDTNLIKSESINNEEDNINIKTEPSKDDLSDDVEEMEHDALQESSKNIQIKHGKPDLDLHSLHFGNTEVHSISSSEIPKLHVRSVDNINAKKKARLKIPAAEKQIECSVCQKKFKNSYIKYHMRMHKGERPFQCDICQQTFTLSSNLKCHMKIHRDKQFECSVCQAKFIRSAGLTLHMRKHTGEALFQCNICQQKFTDSNQLTVHKRTHTGATPFECKICEKKFKYASSLTIHSRMHTDETPFECMYVRRNSLNVAL